VTTLARIHTRGHDAVDTLGHGPAAEKSVVFRVELRILSLGRERPTSPEVSSEAGSVFVGPAQRVWPCKAGALQVMLPFMSAWYTGTPREVEHGENAFQL
jgi:hypothetical protein